MEKLICPKCGADNDNNVKFCGECGQNLSEGAMQEQPADNINEPVKDEAPVTPAPGATFSAPAFENMQAPKKEKKNMLKWIIPVCIVAVIAVGGFIAKGLLSADAVIDTSKVDIKIEISGDYDGYGEASAYLSEYPTIEKTSLKYENQKDLEKLNLIDSYIYGDIEIVLDKEKNLKNGDEVTATVKFNSPEGLRLKFTSDEITKSIKVSGLGELVESYASVPDSFKETIKTDVEAEIADYFADNSYYSNLKTEQIGIYQKTYDPEEYTEFELMYLYKVDYDQKTFFSDNQTEHKSTYFMYNVDGFKKRGEALVYDVYRYDDGEATAISKAQNQLIVDGYEQVKN